MPGTFTKIYETDCMQCGSDNPMRLEYLKLEPATCYSAGLRCLRMV